MTKITCVTDYNMSLQCIQIIVLIDDFQQMLVYSIPKWLLLEPKQFVTAIFKFIVIVCSL